MPQKKAPPKTINPDTSTEQKIKDTARLVFYRKGFAATRTRDIAREAGINLALLNYYFRSKEKLFEIIMMETLTGFFQNIVVMLNDEKTTLDQKITEIVSRYIDLIIGEPEIPTFIITEVRNNPEMLLTRIPVKQILTTSVFFKQHLKGVQTGKIAEPNPLHFMMNLISLIVFPFIARPMIAGGTGLKDTAFNQLMLERKKLIPVWVKAIMKAK